MPQSRWLTIAAAFAIVVTGCAKDENKPQVDPKEAPVTAKTLPEATQPQPSIGALGETVVADFNKRIKDYVDLREKQVATLPKLPDKATPKQIDANQRALAELMIKARPGARTGDIFVTEMQTFVRGLIRRVLTGPDGPRIKASLMDENPMGVKIEVNGRYPDTIPMSTMPPDVLAALPKLPTDLEYRFVGNRLILLDLQSHLIVDFVENTFDV
jgi:hypothetical protein